MNSNNSIIIYDIRDKKRLMQVEKLVSSYAHRVQKSVFESDAPLNSLEDLKKMLFKIIDTEEDFILFFKVCDRDWQKKESYGKHNGTAFQNDKYTIL